MTDVDAAEAVAQARLRALYGSLGPRRVYLPRLSAALPSVSTAPPTITYSAGGAASAIAGATEHFLRSPVGLGAGVTIATASPTSTFDASGVVNGSVLLTGVASFSHNADGYVQSTPIGPELPVWSMSVITDDPVIEVVYLGSLNPAYRLLVDDQAVTQNGTTASGGSGFAQRMKIAFPSRKFRRITLESSSMFIRSVTTGPLATLYAASRKPYTFGFLGDSYMANGGVDGIAPTAARLLGVEWAVNGSGGTGYNNGQGGTDGKQIFAGAARMPALLASSPLDALVIAGGINDGTTALAADVTSLLATAKRTLPPDRIFVLGPWDPPSQTHTTSQAKRDTIRTATLAAGCQFIDNVAGAWIVGTGTTAAPAGAGNADLYIASDGTHPIAPDGYIYHGVRLAAALAERLAA